MAKRGFGLTSIILTVVVMVAVWYILQNGVSIPSLATLSDNNPCTTVTKDALDVFKAKFGFNWNIITSGNFTTKEECNAIANKWSIITNIPNQTFSDCDVGNGLYTIAKFYAGQGSLPMVVICNANGEPQRQSKLTLGIA